MFTTTVQAQLNVTLHVCESGLQDIRIFLGLVPKESPCIIILVITFMQGIYNYIPETNHVSRVYSVAGVLYLQFVLHVMLFHP
jgi:hypothetical protein